MLSSQLPNPQEVFSFFYAICEIPRGSGNEEGISAYLCEFAKTHGLEFRTDALHNVLIRKPATPDCAGEAPVLLQGHMDMVCQKADGVEHDFRKDPIQPEIRDGWLRAKGTTLGADNGIAVAMMLAVLADETISHPDLECLFTVQEETGLIGAAGFDYSDLRAKVLFNLDSEDEGVGTVGCAGGMRVDLSLSGERTPAGGALADLTVVGFRGGHSGSDIHLGRADAHRVAGAVADEMTRLFGARIVSVSGGTLDNAIPSSCRITLIIPASRAEEAAVGVKALLREAEEANPDEKNAGARFDCSFREGEEQAFSLDDSLRITGLIRDLPGGVLQWSKDLEGCVETSCNVGIVRTDGNLVSFGALARYSTEDGRQLALGRIDEQAGKYRASYTIRSSYPGWAYDPSSLAEKRYCSVYRSITGEDPKIEVIHAGLECGVIRNAVPGLSAISIGPNMRGVHTPDEGLDLASAERTFELLKRLLSYRDPT
ncbi:MAG: beta-Ala-His dipeptidase [Clostridia bacterium]|nr:beta-Ala-His dipeptidase [Clostridia bacterium]